MLSSAFGKTPRFCAAAGIATVAFAMASAVALFGAPAPAAAEAKILSVPSISIITPRSTIHRRVRTTIPAQTRPRKRRSVAIAVVNNYYGERRDTRPDGQIERLDDGRVRIIETDRELCEAGYECVIRLGASASAPKIITNVGRYKR